MLERKPPYCRVCGLRSCARRAAELAHEVCTSATCGVLGALQFALGVRAEHCEAKWRWSAFCGGIRQPEIYLGLLPF